MLTWLVDGVLAVLLVEVLALVFARRHLPRLPGLPALLPNLAAGLFLVLAVRSALSDRPVAVMLCLAAAGVAHVLDLRSRIRP